MERWWGADAGQAQAKDTAVGASAWWRPDTDDEDAFSYDVGRDEALQEYDKARLRLTAAGIDPDTVDGRPKDPWWVKGIKTLGGLGVALDYLFLDAPTRMVLGGVTGMMQGHGFDRFIMQGNEVDQWGEEADYNNITGSGGDWHAPTGKELLLMWGMSQENDEKGKVDLIDTLGIAVELLASPAAWVSGGASSAVKGSLKGGTGLLRATSDDIVMQSAKALSSLSDDMLGEALTTAGRSFDDIPRVRQLAERMLTPLSDETMDATVSQSGLASLVDKFAAAEELNDMGVLRNITLDTGERVQDAMEVARAGLYPSEAELTGMLDLAEESTEYQQRFLKAIKGVTDEQYQASTAFRELQLRAMELPVEKGGFGDLGGIKVGVPFHQLSKTGRGSYSILTQRQLYDKAAKIGIGPEMVSAWKRSIPGRAIMRTFVSDWRLRKLESTDAVLANELLNLKRVSRARADNELHTGINALVKQLSGFRKRSDRIDFLRLIELPGEVSMELKKVISDAGVVELAEMNAALAARGLSDDWMKEFPNADARMLQEVEDSLPDHLRTPFRQAVNQAATAPSADLTFDIAENSKRLNAIADEYREKWAMEQMGIGRKPEQYLAKGIRNEARVEFDQMVAQAKHGLEDPGHLKALEESDEYLNIAAHIFERDEQLQQWRTGMKSLDLSGVSYNQLGNAMDVFYDSSEALTPHERAEVIVGLVHEIASTEQTRQGALKQFSEQLGEVVGAVPMPGQELHPEMVDDLIRAMGKEEYETVSLISQTIASDMGDLQMKTDALVMNLMDVIRSRTDNDEFAQSILSDVLRHHSDVAGSGARVETVWDKTRRTLVPRYDIESSRVGGATEESLAYIAERNAHIDEAERLFALEDVEFMRKGIEDSPEQMLAAHEGVVWAGDSAYKRTVYLRVEDPQEAAAMPFQTANTETEFGIPTLKAYTSPVDAGDGEGAVVGASVRLKKMAIVAEDELKDATPRKELSIWVGGKKQKRRLVDLVDEGVDGILVTPGKDSFLSASELHVLPAPEDFHRLMAGTYEKWGAGAKLPKGFHPSMAGSQGRPIMTSWVDTATGERQFASYSGPEATALRSGGQSQSTIAQKTKKALVADENVPAYKDMSTRTTVKNLDGYVGGVRLYDFDPEDLPNYAAGARLFEEAIEPSGWATDLRYFFGQELPSDDNIAYHATMRMNEVLETGLRGRPEMRGDYVAEEMRLYDEELKRFRAGKSEMKEEDLQGWLANIEDHAHRKMPKGSGADTFTDRGFISYTYSRQHAERRLEAYRMMNATMNGDMEPMDMLQGTFELWARLVPDTARPALAEVTVKALNDFAQMADGAISLPNSAMGMIGLKDEAWSAVMDSIAHAEVEGLPNRELIQRLSDEWSYAWNSEQNIDFLLGKGGYDEGLNEMVWDVWNATNDMYGEDEADAIFNQTLFNTLDEHLSHAVADIVAGEHQVDAYNEILQNSRLVMGSQPSTYRTADPENFGIVAGRFRHPDTLSVGDVAAATADLEWNGTKIDPFAPSGFANGHMRAESPWSEHIIYWDGEAELKALYTEQRLVPEPVVLEPGAPKTFRNEVVEAYGEEAAHTYQHYTGLVRYYDGNARTGVALSKAQDGVQELVQPFNNGPYRASGVHMATQATKRIADSGNKARVVLPETDIPMRETLEAIGYRATETGDKGVVMELDEKLWSKFLKDNPKALSQGVIEDAGTLGFRYMKSYNMVDDLDAPDRLALDMVLEREHQMHMNDAMLHKGVVDARFDAMPKDWAYGAGMREWGDLTDTQQTAVRNLYDDGDYYSVLADLTDEEAAEVMQWADTARSYTDGVGIRSHGELASPEEFDFKRVWNEQEELVGSMRTENMDFIEDAGFATMEMQVFDFLPNEMPQGERKAIARMTTLVDHYKNELQARLAPLGLAPEDIAETFRQSRVEHKVLLDGREVTIGPGVSEEAVARLNSLFAEPGAWVRRANEYGLEPSEFAQTVEKLWKVSQDFNDWVGKSADDMADAGSNAARKTAAQTALGRELGIPETQWADIDPDEWLLVPATYAPHVRKPESDVSLWRRFFGAFSETDEADVNSRVFYKPVSTKNPNVDIARTINGAAESVNRLFGREFFYEDPAKAMSLYIQRAVKSITAFDMLDDLMRMTDGYGRAVVLPANFIKETGEWAADRGWKLFEMREMSAFGRDIDGLAKRFPEQADRLRAIGEVEGGVRLMAREDVVDEMEKAVRSFLSDEQMEEFLKTYDKVLGIWKSYATVLRPGFHVRNWLSNMWLNMYAGVINPGRYVEAAKLQKVGQTIDDFILEEVVSGGGKLWDVEAAYDHLVKSGRAQAGSIKVGKLNVSYGHAYKMLREKGIVGTGRVGSDIHIFTEQQLARLNPLRGSANPLSQAFLPTRAGRKLGEMIENNARVAHFLDMLEVTRDSSAAAWSTKRYLFDYNELTDIERHVFRRVMPFYSWIRKNAGLQTEMLVKRPFLVTAPIKTMENLNRIDDTEYQPEWVDEIGAFALPGLTLGRVNSWANAATGGLLGLDETDESSIMLGLGLPFLDLLSLNTKDQFSAVSPLIKAPIETITNYNVFYESPIEDFPGDLGAAPRAFSNVDAIVQTRADAQTLSAWDDMLNSWGVYRRDDGALMTGPWFTYFWKQASPHIEAYGKAIKTEDPATFADMLNFWTGVKLIPADQERVGYYEERERTGAMLDYIKATEMRGQEVPTWGEIREEQEEAYWWQ